MDRTSAAQARWSTIVGAGIALLGATLLLIPLGGREAVTVTGVFLLGAAVMELVLSFRIADPSLRRIELILGFITLGSALLILANPVAIRLGFVAIVCLAARGLGAIAVAFFSGAAVWLWILVQGVVHIVLGAILIVGTPLMAVISILAGTRWPPGTAAILANFIAVSLLATGISLIGVGMALRSRRDHRILTG